MEIIYDGRATGKTIKLIRDCAVNGGRIICANRIEAKHIAELASDLRWSIPFPITFSEFTRDQYFGLNIPYFYIDNADAFLQYLTNVKIKTITINKSEEAND